MNKYERVPEHILDLHGKNTREARNLLDAFLLSSKYKHIRIITGKGTFRETGSVMRNFVSGFLKERGINFQIAKISNGGEGALEVYL